MEAEIGPSDQLSVDGGLTGSPYFLQFLADLTSRTVVRRGNAELPAFGCADLAGWTAELATPSQADIDYQPRATIQRQAIYQGALDRSAGWHSL